MDGENNGKPYEQMDDLGVPLFWKHPYTLYVSKNRGKIPQIIHFYRDFHYKPSILGYQFFLENTQLDSH